MGSSKITDWEDVPPHSDHSGINDWEDVGPEHGAPRGPFGLPSTIGQIGDDVVQNLPIIGATVGGAFGTPADVFTGPLGTVAGAGVGGYLGTAAKNLINHYVSPEKAPQTTAEAVLDPIAGGVQQAGYTAGGQLAAGALGKIAEPIAKYFRGNAESLAESATGATGRQAQEFVPGTGGELLDRKIVGPFNSPGDIARKANAAMDSAEATKADILQNQLKDTTVDRNTVYNYIRQKIKDLSGNEGGLPLARKLEERADDVLQVADTAGSGVPIAQADRIRRDLDALGKWSSSSDSALNDSYKTAAGAYRKAVESAATEANPSLGELFKESKDTQRLLIPVADAAEKRASTLAQSPVGGFSDMLSAGLGALKGGKPGAVAGVAAKRALFPRISSTGAWTLNNLSGLVQSSPQAFGKFAQPLLAASERGDNSLAATHFVLQQTSEEYRKIIRGLDGQEEEKAPEEDRILAGHQ